MLTRFQNFINRHCAKGNTSQNKQDAEKYILAWVPCDDAPAGSVYVRADNFCLKRMINPLADSDHKQSGEQQEGMYICNALNVENQRGDCSARPQYYEYVIPVLYLKSGEQLIQFGRDPFASFITIKSNK